MTKDEFYVVLKEKTVSTGAKWELKNGKIRFGKHCPLSFVAGVLPCSVVNSERELKMYPVTSYDIANAADGYGSTETRTYLLNACGLDNA